MEWHSCKIPLSPETLHKWRAEGGSLDALALAGDPAGSGVDQSALDMQQFRSLSRGPCGSQEMEQTQQMGVWPQPTSLQGRAGAPVLIIHQINSPFFMAQVLLRVINVRRVQHFELQASLVISARITHTVNTTGKFKQRQILCWKGTFKSY